MASTFSLSALFLFFLVCAAAGQLGGKKEIPDVKNDKEVQELGRFCVNEYNKEQKGHHLSFIAVVKGETQVVSGVKYYLKISAKDGGASKIFEAQVVVKEWLHYKKLLSFTPVN